MFLSKKIQGQPEILTSLDFKWSKRGLFANGPDFEWELKSGSPTILNPYKNVWIPNGCDHS